MASPTTTRSAISRSMIFNIVILAVSVTAIVMLWRQNTQLASELTTCQADTSCDGACPTCYKDSCIPFPQVDREFVANLVRNYREHHWKTVNKYCAPFATAVPDPLGNMPIDSRSAWYRLQDLKAFIKTIETSACALGCDQNPDLGIRIYYGEYKLDGSDFLANGVVTKDGNGNVVANTAYKGLHTLVMIPTYFDSERGLDMDFDPAPGKPCPGYTYDTLVSTPGTTIFALPPSGQASGRNHGGLTPPPYKASEYWTATGATFMMYADRTDWNNGAINSAGGTVTQSNPFNMGNWPPVK